MRQNRLVSPDNRQNRPKRRLNPRLKIILQIVGVIALGIVVILIIELIRFRRNPAGWFE